MKSPLRLIKGSQQAGKKAAPREQRFRYGISEVWEVSCGPARKGVGADQQVGPRNRRRAS